jgi:hypothetical protein
MMDKPKKLSVDARKFADEVKSFLCTRKADLIDNRDPAAAIECWPDPDDGSCPEMSRVASLWEELFEYADGVTGDDGGGFPDDAAKQYEAEIQNVADMVNADESFWKEIRAEVLPLYRGGQFKKTGGGNVEFSQNEGPSPWDRRWKSVKIFYDPIGMQVTTTKYIVNKKTGERKKEGVVSDRTIPPGFVIKVL